MSVQKHDRTVVYTCFDRADAMGHGQALSRYTRPVAVRCGPLLGLQRNATNVLKQGSTVRVYSYTSPFTRYTLYNTPLRHLPHVQHALK